MIDVLEKASLWCGTPLPGFSSEWMAINTRESMLAQSPICPPPGRPHASPVHISLLVFKKWHINFHVYITVPTYYYIVLAIFSTLLIAKNIFLKNILSVSASVIPKLQKLSSISFFNCWLYVELRASLFTPLSQFLFQIVLEITIFSSFSWALTEMSHWQLPNIYP